MGIDIQKAEVNSQTAEMMKTANRAIENAMKNVNLDELAKVRHRMDGLKQQGGAVHELIVNGEGDMEINAGAQDLLAQLEEENNQMMMMEMAEIPQGIPAMGGRMVSSVK
jgi:hypothetical protein